MTIQPMRRAAFDGSGREMSCPVVHEILVGFIVNVVEAMPAAEVVDLAQQRLRIDGAGRIVGADGDHRPRAIGDGTLNPIGLQLVTLVRGHADRAAIRHDDRHLVVEIVRQVQNDLVAGIGHGQHRVDETHVGAGRHDHPLVGAEADAVLGGELSLDRLQQFGNALDGLVLVILQVGQELLDMVNGLRRRPVPGDALSE
jgi:hypothetical protein